MKNKVSSTTYGTILVLIAFFTWGLSPFYFKSINMVNPFEILAHRILWSILFLFAIIAMKKQIFKIIEVFYSPKAILTLACTAILISANWFTYIWAVINNHLTESSFGYFISPIFNIFLGLIFLKEKLNKIEIFSVIITIIAIAIQFSEMTFTGFAPLVPILLALTFGFYSLLRKKINIDSIHGLTIETLLLAPLALIYIINLGIQHELSFLSNAKITGLLLLAGVITSIPLITFVAGAKLLPMTKIGFYQYISPTLQLILAMFVFQEKISQLKIISFCLVWLAIIIYILNSIRKYGIKKVTNHNILNQD
ncbi:EamA family transporter RarD [Pigmentibacter ruber]|uniref:EamA family transporter RarD n=1 Tax=Pigmentibacter ruber TaxID=2683196 RepID=UPI00131A6E8B|nr:EamA family transporter RarD [Pigmentibacter ruber]